MRDRVGKRVAEFLHQQRPALDEISPDVGALIDRVAEYTDGGKRLRALFCYWGWRSAGAPDCEPIIAAAAAMELLQAAALVHDDVMDRSESRRGRPAMHRQLAALHRAGSWAGSADHFGSAAAILVGDLCLVWSDELCVACGLPQTALDRGKPVFDTMRSELMAGQYLDLLEQARRNTDVTAALHVATYKSAKYTVERPLHLGAALAGGSAELVSALRQYGVALGRAFQLRDDVLGVFGDSAHTGKPAGDDLREGKRTVLVALALADLGEPDRAQLLAGLEDPGQPPETTARLAELIAGTSARDQAEAMIGGYAAEARSALTQAPLEPAAAQVLDQLVTVATERSA